MRFPVTLRLGLALGVFALTLAENSCAQNMEQAPKVALQPLAQQVRQVEEALSFLGQPLAARGSCPMRARLMTMRERPTGS